MSTAGIVVVGAGPAGWWAARSMRRLGHDGPITLLGAEPHATYERPPLSKAYLTGERDAASLVMARPEAIDAAGVTFRAAANVVAIDRDARRVRLHGGEELAYDRLLLATGREPRRLGWGGVDERRVHVLRDLDDADRLRPWLGPNKSLAVIGGGFIGLEVAASARVLGTAVAVIELAPRLMGRAVPEPIAAFVEARHRAEGVDIRLGRRVATVHEEPSRLRITLDDDSVLHADAILVGIGAAPRTKLAIDAGLEVDGGIVTDASLRTRDPLIFAAGDVVALRWPDGTILRQETWKNAEVQGTLAARTMLGADARQDAMAWFWSDQYDLSLQVAGSPEHAVAVVERPLGPTMRLLFHLDGQGRLVAATGVGGAGFGREMTIARRLVERGTTASPAQLAAADVPLKSLIR